MQTKHSLIWRASGCQYCLAPISPLEIRKPSRTSGLTDDGRYDVVLIPKFPSDEACAKFTLSAGALGNISTETLKAFSEADYRKICGSL